VKNIWRNCPNRFKVLALVHFHFPGKSCEQSPQTGVMTAIKAKNATLYTYFTAMLPVMQSMFKTVRSRTMKLKKLRMSLNLSGKSNLKLENTAWTCIALTSMLIAQVVQNKVKILELLECIM
jgi:hypothetical protein